MKHRTFIILAFGAFLGLTAGVSGQNASQDMNAALAKLRSPDLEERSGAAVEISGQRRQIVLELLKVAGEDPEIPFPLKPPKAKAIGLLARYRANDVEVIDFLIDDITYRPRDTGKPFSITGGYASKNALVKIGLPSIDGIFRRLEEPVSKQELQLFAHIFKEIFGGDIGLFRLERELQEYMSKENRTRLEKLIEIYKEGPGVVEIGGEVY